MRILLIDPPFKRFTGFVNNYFPLGLASLAALLRKEGHEVRIFETDSIAKGIDVDFSDEYRRLEDYVKGVNDDNHEVWRDVSNVLNEYQPDLIGLTIMTQKFASALKTAETCKKWNADCKIIAGGPHSTILPELTLQSPFIDLVIRGEAEKALLQFVKIINAPSRWKEVRGLAYRDNGKIINSGFAEMIGNLDEIPFPARDLLINGASYSSEDMGMVMGSRGCPFNCSFCFHMWERGVRYRSTDNVIGEIKFVKSKYGTKQFAFKDDSFTVNRKRVVELCEKMIQEKLNINWDCTTRVNLLDEELLRIMLKAGCNVIKIGIESGSERMLKEMKKGITIEQIRKAAKLLNKHNVFWSAYFMMGLPTETEEDIMKTYELIKEIKPFYCGLGVYNPMPNTELFDAGVKMGILYPDVGIDHFFKVNPKDYFFKDPRRRVLYIDPDRFNELISFMTGFFHKNNTRFSNLMRRGWARKNLYLSDPAVLFSDCRKACNWVFK